ncbi:MAG: hypothetical protein ACI9R3_003584 [Verrucomicrobiales bacterium]|jgi:hypothetical protein
MIGDYHAPSRSVFSPFGCGKCVLVPLLEFAQTEAAATLPFTLDIREL